MFSKSFSAQKLSRSAARIWTGKSKSNLDADQSLHADKPVSNATATHPTT